MITIGGINLNGAEAGTSKFSIDPESGFDIGAPPPKWQWIDRRIGAIPVPNPSLPPMTIEIPLICVGTSANNILAEIGALRKVCDAVAGTVSQGGTEVSWQMIGATNASALICYAAEVGPVKIDRDDIHTRVGRFTLTLTCDPYILGPWAPVATGRKPAGVPAKEVQISGLAGDIPGPARITLTNQGSTAQQFAMLGLDCVDSSTAAANDLVLLPSTFDYTTAPLNGTYTAGTNEVQTATKSGTISGGTFTLTYEGQTTSSLAYNASTATVQTALEALTTIGTGNITVGGTTLDAGNMTFTFTGTFANCDVSLIVLNSSLTGGGSAPITQTTQGVSGYVANTSLQSSWSDFMRTGDQTDTGSFQLWALVYTDASQNEARVRASISIGDTGTATINRSASVPATSAPVWINLGPVHANKRISSGSYRWTATIGAMTVGTVGTDVRILRLAKLPVANGVGVVKTPQATTRALVASDDGNQSAGALNGKLADVGGAYSRAGDSNDFDATGTAIERTATGDSAGVGCFELLSVAHSDVEFYSVVSTTSGGGGTPLLGNVVRYVDINNYALVYVTGTMSAGSLGSRSIYLVKCIAGTRSVIASGAHGGVTGLGGMSISLRTQISASGTFTVESGAGTGTSVRTTLNGADAVFATGGTLASGVALGWYDEYQSATAGTRRYGELLVEALPASSSVIHPSRKLAWQPDGSLETEASGGTYFGYTAGQQRAGVPLLDPSGTNRLAIASADFNPDVAGSSAQNVPLSYSVEHRPAFAIGRH